MRTDRETRELQAIWKFLYDLTSALERVHARPTLVPSDMLSLFADLDDLKKHIKDTAAAYGTKL